MNQSTWEIIESYVPSHYAPSDARVEQLFRKKTYGGWLVKEITCRMNGDDVLVTMTFVPDANHEWKI